MNRITTTLVFLRRGGEILLAMKKTGHGKGLWNGIGGKVDQGETIEQAMIRECQEEVGVKPLTFDKMAQNSFFQLYKGVPTENVCHTYLCDKWEGVPTETEEMAPRWFSVAELPWEQMWPSDHLYVPQILDGKKFLGEFHFDDDNNIAGYTLTEVAELS